MAIKTSVDKYKESSKDSAGMSAQTEKVTPRSGIIKSTVDLPSFGTDPVMKGVYTGYLPHPAVFEGVKSEETKKNSEDKTKRA